MKTCLVLAIVGFFPLVLLFPLENNNAGLETRLDTFESLKDVNLPSSDGATTRDKRTIGPLRQIFPNLSQLVDSKIQMITRVLFRVIGRLVLRGGLGGGGGGNSAGSSNSSAGGNGRRISITLPTYPPGEDEDEDEEDSNSDTETTTEGDSKNQLDGAESQVNEVRVPFDNSNPSDINDGADLETAASEDGDAQVADAQDVAADASDDEEATDEQRNKRFLNFNLGGGAGGAGGAAGGSGGGSGNFLFDIIRLVAGSGNTEAGDERANSAVGVANAEQTVEKDDGYQAGVPGPITRLFIIANRGLANLMQDLILRLAQTSERIVNFKARLITSII